MGVPKFFYYLYERYPCLCQFVKESQIPDFDNLYLDINGIIHSCSHPNEFDVDFSITEETIFASIFHYIEVLFNMIKPKKLFYIAVDGVAPTAKMNQQRARRFRNAKEVEIREKEAINNGKKDLIKNRFDTNCITPGTVFMDQLQNQLKYFLASKISTDVQWQSCKIILSGHQTPGEGEHKIMNHIRYMKAQPDYDENTTHCLYGLDADLIMLGMCSHEPHFSLLREKVQRTKNQKRILSPDETDFYLLHLSLLREYLDLEFKVLKEALPFQYNLESIIDDWVLMSFLVGNDFVPNLPNLDIHKGAFTVLHETYRRVLPTLEGYLNENGYLNLSRFEEFMKKLADYDFEAFENAQACVAYLEKKTGKNSFFYKKEPNGHIGKSSELEKLIKATNDSFKVSDDECQEEETDENERNYTFMLDFDQHKKNYYKSKLNYSTVTPEVLKSQAECYVRALQWILHYYYHGCRSWSWYYPHHYAPYISDIRDFKDMKLDFDMGKPVLPFMQLLAVLPTACKELIPHVYHHLMTSPDSPIKEFYPEEFEIDINGKQHDWEAVVLIPFIDSERLLEAMESCNERLLTPEERKRNQHRPLHIYTYTHEDLGPYDAVKYFPRIPSNHALVKDVYSEEFAVEICNLKFGLSPGALLGTLYPEFPTLQHIPHTASPKMAKVRVFEAPSTKENMILTLQKRELPPLKDLVKSLLGKIVYVNWPYLVESRVIALSTKKGRYFLKEDSQIAEETFQKKQEEWIGEGQDITKHYSENLGVEIGPIEVIVHVLTLDGQKYVFGPNGNITYEKIWSTNSTACALQVVLQDIQFQDSRRNCYVDFKDAFQVNSVVFMLGQPHFGSMGRVLDSKDCYKNRRLKVELETVKEQDFRKALSQIEAKVSYYPCNMAALKLGISPRLFSRITGCIFVTMSNNENFELGDSKFNIGLSLKFFKKNEEIPGFTKLKNGNWLYSTRTVDVVAEYVKKFPHVIDFMSDDCDTTIYSAEDIFSGPDGFEKLKEIVEWIKTQEYKKIDRVKCGTQFLDPGTVAKIEEITNQNQQQITKRCLKVKPHLLYKNDLVWGNVQPVKVAENLLLDRVVSIRSSHTVPTGLRGFIISKHPAPLDSDYTYDVLFDKPFVGGIKLHTTSGKVFRMSKASFLNISDANRQCKKPVLIPFDVAPANEVSLRPSYQKPEASAFVQFSQEPSQTLVRSCDDDDQFKKIWMNLQAAKPQEEALKKILKIEKKDSEKIEDPVKSFFEKMTRVASNAPKPIESTQQKSKYSQLLFYFQKQGLVQPKFKFVYWEGKVTAQVYLNDGRVYSGLPCGDKKSACESASLETLGALGEIPLHNDSLLQKQRQREKDKRILENQALLSNALRRPQEDKAQNKPPQTNQRCNNETPGWLPDPPSQWVEPRKNLVAKGFPVPTQEEYLPSRPRTAGEKKPQNVPNKKLNTSALNFVPLQAITGKRNYGKIKTIQTPTQTAEVQKKTEIVATCINSAGTSTAVPKPNRRPKIAAKLNLDPNLY